MISEHCTEWSRRDLKIIITSHTGVLLVSSRRELYLQVIIFAMSGGRNASCVMFVIRLLLIVLYVSETTKVQSLMSIFSYKYPSRRVQPYSPVPEVSSQFSSSDQRAFQSVFSVLNHHSDLVTSVPGRSTANHSEIPGCPSTLQCQSTPTLIFFFIFKV